MNDRFKFRVWLKNENRFGYLLNLFSCGTNSQYEVEEYDKQGDHYTVYSADEVILQQCTGLRDKNGKLIYEGDIVKDFTYTHDVKYICAFVPILGGLGLISKQDLKDYNFCEENWESYGINKEVRRLDNRFKLANQGNKLKCFSMGKLLMTDYEVIGNIYENPELLTEEVQA